MHACVLALAGLLLATSSSAQSHGRPLLTVAPGLDAVVRELVQHGPHDAATVCVTVAAEVGPLGEVDAAFLRAASLPGRRSVGPRECPPTLESSPIASVDSLGRPVPPRLPPGHRDPFRVAIRADSADAMDMYRTWVRTTHGTGFRDWECWRHGTAATDWKVICRVLRWGVH